MPMAPAATAITADMAEAPRDIAPLFVPEVVEGVAAPELVPVLAGPAEEVVAVTIVPLPPGFCPTGAEGANVPGLPLGSVMVKRVV